MQYTLEVNEPFSFTSGYFHNLIIEQPTLSADDCEGIRLELETHPDTSHVMDVMHHGDDRGEPYHVADYSQFFFDAPRDLSAEFPALIERALAPEER